MKKYNLVDLQLHKEEIDKGAEWYYLSAVYQYENERGVYEVNVPRIELPISGDLIMRHDIGIFGPCRHTIDIGFGDLDIFPDKHGNNFYEKCIKEKIHDMTLDEIEKKLGYKVRVVSEKEE